jgi:hypothetical protein
MWLSCLSSSSSSNVRATRSIPNTDAADAADADSAEAALGRWFVEGAAVERRRHTDNQHQPSHTVVVVVV